MGLSATRKYFTCLVFIFTTMFSMAVSSVHGAGPTLQRAPLNPAFVEYVAGRMDRFMCVNEEEVPRGFVPAPVDLSYLKGMKIFGDLKAALPSYYDLRDTGKLTRVEDQGSCGSCWTFSSLGSMESVLMPGEECDFSENNMKNLNGFDGGCCDGGQELKAMAYLARWDGPVNESDDPYNPDSCASPLGLTVRKHFQNGIIIPDRTGSLDNNDIKQAVVTYGAVSTGMYWDDDSYNAATYSYYYTGGVTNGNHKVCVVGWDDNYNKNKFSPAAPGNGAFIIKNSWGTAWGDDGFFYVSYYDKLIGISNWVGVGTEPTSNYSAVYQYDTLGWCGNYGYNNETVWFANKFTATSTSSISAVGWYAVVPATTYEIRVYTDPTSGPISGGTLRLTQTGTAANPGYVTIKLNSPVSVTNGHKFTVLVKTITPGCTYPLALEYPIENYSSRATSNPDESFTSLDGNSWFDLNYYDANACLKAYTASAAGTVSTPTFLPDGGTYTNPQAVTISCATAGAEIHYTTDGDDPTTGDPVIASGGSVTVSSSLTLKAKAWKSRMNPSAVKSAVYTISSVITNDSLTPSDGYLRGYWKYTFVSKHSDTGGASTIKSVRLLINTARNGTNAVYCIYYGGRLYLRDDTGSISMGGYTPGSDEVIENSQCKLCCKYTTVSMSGNTLTINWVIEMKPSMADKVCYGWLYAVDNSGNSKGWDEAGDYTFRPLTEPWNVCLIPVSATFSPGAIYTVSSVYFDIACCSSISMAALLINDRKSTSNAVYVWYNVQTDRLYLRDDTGGRNIGGYTPGSNYVIENSQCKLYCKNTTVQNNINGLAINWSIELKPSMSGKKCKCWLYVKDVYGVYNGWSQMGSRAVR
ncbi:lectin like domain-containing protein [bacterium]|nr:lectin like domain-containing protein [bacterium]